MSANNKSTITILSRQAPYGKDRAQLGVDIALASVVFDQEVHVVFLDDGVYQLCKDQDASAIAYKTLSNAIETFELYGVNRIYVDSSSLAERNLNENDLLIPVEKIDKPAIADIISNSNTIINL